MLFQSEETFFFKEGEWLIKEKNQCSSKILIRNYLASTFALAGIPTQTGQVAYPPFITKNV